MTTNNPNGQTAPPVAPPTPPLPSALPASLGTLTDEEQRVYNTVIATGGDGVQSVINLRAQNAGVAAINSGAASTVTVTPKGDVTTVTTTPDTTKPGTNVTNTGTASATDTGVKVTVPVPPVTPVTDDDDAYVFTNANNKEIEVKTSEYDSWTPAQQLAWQTSQGLINSKPPVNTPSYVKDSTGKDTGVLAKYTNSDGTIDIQAALKGGVTADYILSHTQASASDVKLAQAINKVNGVLKANKDGTYNTDDINAAVASGKLTQSDVDTVFGKQTTIKTTTPGTSPSLTGDRINADIAGATYPASYSQDDWDKDIASGKIAAGSVFGSYDPKTGLVSYTTAADAAASKAVMTEINTALTSKKPNGGNVDALNTAIEDAGLWNNSALNAKRDLQTGLLYDAKTKQVLTQQDQVNLVWKSLTPDQQATVAGIYSQDAYGKNPFSETIKNIAVAGQEGGILGQMAVAPLTGIALPIAKATSGQHVTAQDIEGAVITAVGDVLMIGGGETLVSAFGNAGKVIVNTLLTGMGTVGVVDTVMQAKAGKTAGSTLAVEAALSVAALVGGAGGLVSSIVPKETPDIDVAQQFVNKMKSQTTPEGLAKNSPFQAPSNISGDTEFGVAEEPTGTPEEIRVQTNNVNLVQSEVKTLQDVLNDAGKSGDTVKVSDIQDKLDAATQQLDDADTKLAKMQGTTGKPTATPGEISKQAADVNSMQSEVKTLQGILNDAGKSGDTVKVSDIQDKLDAATQQLDDADNQLAKLKMSEASYNQANVTASYKDWTQAATEYAQNQHDINDLTTKIADNRTTLDAITKGSTIPDEYTAKLASDTAKMDSTLANLKAVDDDLATKVNDTGDQFSTSLKAYNTYAKGNGLVFNDSPDEMIKNLPKDSAATIKATVNQLMNGDDSPAAIAKQQEVVDKLQQQYDQFKGKTGQSADIGADLANEQSKLNLMKVGNLQQAQSDLINAREELADVKEIEDNGKLDKTTKQNLVKIQNQLESQISDREAILADVIKGKGMQDIIKVEYIYDDPSEVTKLQAQLQDAMQQNDQDQIKALKDEINSHLTGARMYTNDGVFKYDVDEDGNIIESTKTEESSGGGKSPNTPTETRPSPDTTTPEETGLQQTSRGMPKGGISDVSVIAPMVTTIPTVKIGKNGEVVKPSTKTQTTTTKTTEVPSKQPATNPSKAPVTNPSKTPVEVPETITNPAINPAINPSTQTPVTNPSKTPSKTQVVSPAISPATVQSQIQSQTKGIQPAQGQQMSKAQQISNKTAVSTQIKTYTDTNPPPENNDKTMPPADISKPNITKDAEGFVHVPQGSATWKQGFGYRTLVPPYDQKGFIFTMKPPKGAVIVSNAKSARDTIQRIGKGELPKDMNVKMGIVTVDVKDPPNRPQKHSGSIAFKRIPITNNTASRSAPPHPARFGTGITRRRDR